MPNDDDFPYKGEKINRSPVPRFLSKSLTWWFVTLSSLFLLKERFDNLYTHKSWCVKEPLHDDDGELEAGRIVNDPPMSSGGGKKKEEDRERERDTRERGTL